MPDPLAAGMGAQDAMLFGIAADLTYNIFSATNSSPQTTELFASERSGTLWKYVRLGVVQTALLIGLMAARAKGGGGWGRAVWTIAGGGAAGASMFMMYAHALKSGGGSK